VLGAKVGMLSVVANKNFVFTRGGWVCVALKVYNPVYATSCDLMNKLNNESELILLPTEF